VRNVASAELSSRRDSKAQELVTQALDERLRRIGKAYLGTTGYAAVSLKEPLDQCTSMPVLKVGETTRNALLSVLIVKIITFEGHGRRSPTDDAPRGAVAHNSSAACPVDLQICLAATGLPEMKSPLGKVLPDELHM
jgi:hypothetical protein